MDDSDSFSGPPQADVIPLHRQPTYDANRRWYEEYPSMMHRANDLVVEQVKALRYAAELRHALTDVLAETQGGNFLSRATRDRAQALLQRVSPS
jgi:hypothetical protein